LTCGGVRPAAFFVSYDPLQAFDAVTREGRHAVLANAIDPNLYSPSAPSRDATRPQRLPVPQPATRNVLADIRQIPGPFGAIFRRVGAYGNEIRWATGYNGS